MSRVSQDRRPMSTVGADPRWAEIEVTAKATRRRFTLDYKRKIVQEADLCKTSGAVGALLRREGLYSSHLTTWRAARERGDLADRTVKKRGPVPRVRDPRDKRITELERENAFWRKRAERAEALIEVQKNITPSTPHSHRDRSGTPTRHLADVRGTRGAPGDLLPTAAAPERPAAPPTFPPRAQRRRAHGRSRRAARAALRGSRAGRGLRHPARRGPVSLLGAHDVPGPRRMP